VTETWGVGGEDFLQRKKGAVLNPLGMTKNRPVRPMAIQGDSKKRIGDEEINKP